MEIIIQGFASDNSHSKVFQSTIASQSFFIYFKISTKALNLGTTLIQEDLAALIFMSIFENSTSQISNIFCKSMMEMVTSSRSCAYLKALYLLKSIILYIFYTTT